MWLEAHKTFGWGPNRADLTDAARVEYPEGRPPVYCFEGMEVLFHDRQRDNPRTYPHFVKGNHIRTTRPHELFLDLFSYSLRKGAINRRAGWGSRPYRIATRRSLELIAAALGPAAADGWFLDLERLVLGTMWVLPWPSDSQLITTTKMHGARSKARRLTWASVVHCAPGSEIGEPMPSGTPPILEPAEGTERPDFLSTVGTI